MDDENGGVARHGRFLRERAHPDRPLAIRIAGIVGGLIVLAVGASVAGAGMNVPVPFSDPFESEAAAQRVFDAAQRTADRTIEVQMDMNDGILRGHATIASTKADGLTGVEVLEALEQFPSLTHNVVGDLKVEGVEVVWQISTPERLPDNSAVTLKFEWTQAVDPRLGRVSVQYNPPAWVGQSRTDAAKVRLGARPHDGWFVTGYTPSDPDAVAEQDEDPLF